MNIELIDSPCFITAYPRSGTNLLNRLLDGHRNIVSSPGAGKTHALRKLFYIPWSSLSKQEILNKLTENLEYSFSETGIVEKNIVSKIVKLIEPEIRTNMSYRQVLAIILKGIGIFQNKDIQSVKIWTEKNHNLEFYIHNALKTFTNPRFIFIIRNPLDTWLSWDSYCEKIGLIQDFDQFSLNINLHILEEYEAISTGDNPKFSYEHLIAHYKIHPTHLATISSAYFTSKRNAQVLKDYKLDKSFYALTNTKEGRFAWQYRFMLHKAKRNAECYPKNFKIVRFEDLILDTENTMSQLADFINIPFNPILLQPTEQGQAWESNSSFSIGIKQISSAPIGRYRSKLSNEQISIIQQILSEELEEFEFN
jgi:hypothetical protein